MIISQPEKDIRSRIQEALQRFGIKQVEVARETGVHHSTLCLWLQGKIKGNYVKIEETMEQWLKNLYSNNPRCSKNSVTKLFGGRPFDSKGPSSEMEKKEKVQKDPSQEDDLIPIRLDIEIEGRRFRENICWNIDEPYMSPENFAKIIVEENNLPTSFDHDIANNLKKAIQAHKKYTNQSQEMIKIIELDIRIENISLKDRFEWDINDPNNIPEEFAWKLCDELGLNNEFMSQIAHSIREQVQAYQKQITERSSYRPIDDFSQMKKSTRSLLESSSGYVNYDIKKTFEPIIITEDNYLRPVTQIFTDNTDDLATWEPRIEILDPEDIRKVQKLEDRKIRYEKRRR